MSLIELRNLHRLLILFLFPIPLCFYAPYFLFLRGKRKKRALGAGNQFVRPDA